ncbi:porin [Marinospirillum sp. MEB164]|uniref:Porin n=1 Tax=Marinospirillum alkalitolerans TaxID=3123374 RepID=A0ABW8PUG3_9GAMM
MKKTLIAASIAALAAGSAQAVTLYESETGSFSTYGKIQLELMNYDGENNIQNNGSRFGFSADRQLNHGLEGFANVEFRFNPGVRHDSNVAVAIGEEHMAVRNSYLGVRGGFGSVMAGNFDSLTYSFVTSQADIMENLGFTSVDGGGRNGQGHTIAYLSPEFSGFTFGLAAKHYSSDESQNNDALNSASGDEVFNFQVAAAYQATPELRFAVAYDMNDGDGGYAAFGANNDEAVMAISANYATDLFNVGLVFESHDKAALEQVINLTAGYNYGAGSIYGVVAFLDDGDDTGVDFALGANYNLGEGFLVYGEFALGNDDVSAIKDADGDGTAAVTVGAAYRW